MRGKGNDRLFYRRSDVGEAVVRYLDQRGDVPPDERGVPLITAVGNRAGGERLSRRGLRKIVDAYLSKLGLKRPGVSNPALRHTGATLGYKYTHDLRAVQDLLGHPDPRITARYARVVDKGAQQPSRGTPANSRASVHLIPLAESQADCRQPPTRGTLTQEFFKMAPVAESYFRTSRRCSASSAACTRSRSTTSVQPHQ